MAEEDAPRFLAAGTYGTAPGARWSAGQELDREPDFPMSGMDMDLLVQHMKEAGVDTAVILPLDFGLNEWVF